MATTPAAPASSASPPAGFHGAESECELAVARAVVVAVRGVSGVAGVTPGRFAEAATYGPGEVVRGVAVRRGADGYAIAVHLRAIYPPPLPLLALADRVRRAVGAAVEALGAGPAGPIDIAVDDLRLGEPPDHPNAPARGEG